MKVNFKKQIHPEKILNDDTSDHLIAMAYFMRFVTMLQNQGINFENPTLEDSEFLRKSIEKYPKAMAYPAYMIAVNTVMNPRLNTELSIVKKPEDFVDKDFYNLWKLSYPLKSELVSAAIEICISEPGLMLEMFNKLTKDEHMHVTLTALVTFQSNYDPTEKKIFYCPESFATMICKHGMDKIDSKFLPTNFNAYIQFPKNFFRDQTVNTGTIAGAYVNLYSQPDKCDGFIFEIVCVDNEENLHQRMLYRTILPVEGTIDCNDMIADLASESQLDNKSIDQITLISKLVFNTMVFIHNESMELKYLNDMSSRVARKKEIEMGFNPRQSSIPIWLVNKHFHEMKYNVDSTQVRGHMRWQPYGEKLSKVKLIWIDPHMRTYKTTLAVMNAQIETP